MWTKHIYLSIVVSAFLCSNARAESDSACFSGETKNQIESETTALIPKYIETYIEASNTIYQNSQKFGSIPADELRRFHLQEDVVRKVAASSYEITLSEVYQVGQEFDVAKCKGTLRMEVPGEAYSTAETSYMIIKTQDGKILVRSNGFFSENEYNSGVLFGTLIQYMIGKASR